MNTHRITRSLLILLVIFMNIGCDQISKKIVREKVAPYETISLLSQHFTITNVENPGAFLSLGDSLQGRTKDILLSVIPVIALLFALVYIFMRTALPKAFLMGLCFVIGGGIGNLFDRITYGSVTDFLHIKLGAVQTGIFNMADVSIVAGSLIILFHSLFGKKPPPKDQSTNS